MGALGAHPVERVPFDAEFLPQQTALEPDPRPFAACHPLCLPCRETVQK